VLVVQDDGMLLRKGCSEAVERLLERYDYVGAPWTPGQPQLQPVGGGQLVGGNGGLSLRNVRVMLRCCELRAHQARALFHDGAQLIGMPEDVFFSTQLPAVDGRLPPADVASAFSSEQILNKHCLGVHKVWGYHPLDAVQELLGSFLQNP
jgi:hypothetical protein